MLCILYIQNRAEVIIFLCPQNTFDVNFTLDNIKNLIFAEDSIFITEKMCYLLFYL